MAEDKEISAVKQFLGEVGEDKDPLAQNLEDPFNQVTPEVKEEVVEEKEEKPLPFNKDPKIQKFIEKEISKRLADFKPEVRETETPVDTRMDDVLTRIIGNDTPEKVQGIKDMKELLTGLTGKAKAEAIAELEARQNEEAEADREAEVELETAFENIEEAFDVDITSNSPLAKKTRQEFVSFVEKIAPKDRNGDIVDYPDMTSAWETFSEIKKSTATPSRAKELAARSMARSSETPVVKDTKGLNFDNIIEHLSK